MVTIDLYYFIVIYVLHFCIAHDTFNSTCVTAGNQQRHDVSITSPV